jgi:hypothetical protein
MIKWLEWPLVLGAVAVSIGLLLLAVMFNRRTDNWGW